MCYHINMMDIRDPRRFFRLDQPEVSGEKAIEADKRAKDSELSTLLTELPKPCFEGSLGARQARKTINKITGKDSDRVDLNSLSSKAYDLTVAFQSLLLGPNAADYSLEDVRVFCAAIRATRPTSSQQVPRTEEGQREFLRSLNAALDDELQKKSWDPLEGKPNAGWDHGGQDPDGRDRDDLEPIS